MSSLAPPVEQPQSNPAPHSVDPVIRFEDVSIAFDQPVLDGISFQLAGGETKVLLGESGTGKTLILKLALGLIKPDSGRITVLGEEVSAMREQDMYAFPTADRHGVSGECALRFADRGRECRLPADRGDRKDHG